MIEIRCLVQRSPTRRPAVNRGVSLLATRSVRFDAATYCIYTKECALPATRRRGC
jgi:hypothetical protein